MNDIDQRLIRDLHRPKILTRAHNMAANESDRAYYYATDVIKGRWPEGEPAIIKDPRVAYYYAKNIIKGRWPEAEPTISKDTRSAYDYALYVIKGRWPEAEPTISKDPELAYYYALSVIKGRWPEAEPTISKNPYQAYNYALHVIKRRWPEAEELFCDASLCDLDIIKNYVSKIDWANPLNDFPIPKRIKRALVIFWGG